MTENKKYFSDMKKADRKIKDLEKKVKRLILTDEEIELKQSKTTGKALSKILGVEDESLNSILRYHDNFFYKKAENSKKQI